jgi:hypothetical protein
LGDKSPQRRNASVSSAGSDYLPFPVFVWEVLPVADLVKSVPALFGILDLGELPALVAMLSLDAIVSWFFSGYGCIVPVDSLEPTLPNA